MKSALKIAVASIALLLCFSASAQEQAGMKVLTIEDDPVLQSPLGIEVYLQGKKIKSGVPFKADDEWIGDLQIFVTNRSDDEIKFASFTLDFPTEHSGEPMMKRFRIAYGKDNVFKIEDKPDVEEKRIAKKDSAVVTFNSNDPLSFEAFKHFKKTSSYDPKTWDKGILAVYAVEFENRGWLHGLDFDKKGGVWEQNKEKEKNLHERIKKSTPSDGASKISFVKRSFAVRSQVECFSVPPPPNTGSTRSCTLAAGCQSGARCTYFRPNLINVATGFKKKNISAACSGSGCGGCCEPLVPDLGDICHQ